MIPPRLAKEAVDAAIAWFRHRMWQHHLDTNLVAVRIPGEPGPLFASILGAAGEHFGIAVYQGDDGLAQLREIAFEGGDDIFTIRGPVLSLDMMRPGAVPERVRTIHATAGYSARVVPIFLVYGQGHEPREPRPRELRSLTAVLNALSKAHETGLLRPIQLTPSGPARVLTLTLTGTVRKPEVAAKYEVFAAGDPAAANAAAPGAMPRDALAGLPRLDGRWLVGLRPMAARIKGDERQVYALAVMEESSEKVIHLEPLFGDDVEAAVLALFAVFCGKNKGKVRGLPRSVAFASRRLFEAATPALQAQGVTCTFEASLPLLEHFQEAFHDAQTKPAEPFPVPSPEDELRWEDAQSSLMQRVTTTIAERDLLTYKPVRQYFGEPIEPEVLEEPAVRLALLEWFLVHYRAGKGRRTLAEELLAGDLPAAERAVLAARLSARPAIYRVETSRDDTVVLQDLFSGQRTELHDPRLISVLEEGLCLTGRVCHQGGNDMFQPVGPALPAVLIPQAMNYLASVGLELSADGVAKAPHLLGRLWVWLEKQGLERPELQNTDGHPIVVQTASFTVKDPASVARALAARPDLERDDGSDLWTWLREEGGQRTVLGQIRLIDDRLLLEVNSDERLASARGWLQRVKGVKFERSTIHDLSAQRPVDDQLREPQVPPTPEVVEQAETMLRWHYKKWLDEPVPILGGKTPREAAKTPEGRTQVLILIRSMPDPGGMPGLRAPREELLRELGLLEE